jgi:hypothetical protein
MRPLDWARKHNCIFYLVGTGRSIARVRMAADRLRRPIDGSGLYRQEADYDAYCGVSAARSSIDGFSCWLNSWFGINQHHGAGLDLAKRRFREKLRLVPQLTAVQGSLDDLVNLVSEIDPHRQQAQHREGLVVQLLCDNDGNCDWRILPEGISYPRNNLPAADRLDSWANRIEVACRAVVSVSPTVPLP